MNKGGDYYSPPFPFSMTTIRCLVYVPILIRLFIRILAPQQGISLKPDMPEKMW